MTDSVRNIIDEQGWDIDDFIEFIENKTYCMCDIEEAIEDEFGFSSFDEQWDRKWSNAISIFNSEVVKLNNICANLWVTDCDDNDSLFSKWFYNNYSTDIEDTFLSSDMFISPQNYTEYSIEIEETISAILQLSPNDNSGQLDCYWREEMLNSPQEVMEYLAKLKKIDKVLEILLN